MIIIDNINPGCFFILLPLVILIQALFSVHPHFGGSFTVNSTQVDLQSHLMFIRQTRGSYTSVKCFMVRSLKLGYRLRQLASLMVIFQF